MLTKLMSHIQSMQDLHISIAILCWLTVNCTIDFGSSLCLDGEFRD